MNFERDIPANSDPGPLRHLFHDFGGAEAERDALIAGLRASDTHMADLALAAAAAGWFPTGQLLAAQADIDDRRADLIKHLERRPYRIRPAEPGDAAALTALEGACWAAPLRTPGETLMRRVSRYPAGQLAVVAEERVVGVIYSQRLADAGAIDGATMDDVDGLHDPLGPLVQLLAINIDPGFQDRGLGDQLLEFMLTYRGLQPEIREVVAVTLCREYRPNKDGALQDYIGRRNGFGALADPILRFHELHGARIERVVPGYRPRDLANQGQGVLVRYDIRNRRRAELKPADPSARSGWTRGRIREALREIVIAALGDARPAYAGDRPLMAMGLDSAGIMTVADAVTRRFGVSVSAAVLFEHNSPDNLSGFLAETLIEVPAADARPIETTGSALAAPAPEDDRAVAIVGLACRLPGGIETPEDLWSLLDEGGCAISTLPPGRWSWPDGIDPVSGHHGIDRGGFLDDVAAFDNGFFRISPAEAVSMDPQQRILLELAWRAMEHAATPPERLAGPGTGVFIGASGSDYVRLADAAGVAVEAHSGTGSAVSVLANRISHVFDFTGPSLVLDTACSSSLVAVHEAVKAIRAGEIDRALVGGVNLMLHPATTIAYYRAGMLSRDGLCRTFDAGANGYVRAEGAVVVLLKRLSHALRDGDRIHGLIRGTACNHGGQAAGLTVPNPRLQGDLLATAWRDSGVTPDAIDLLEAHGTGTRLGDPVEIRGIRQALDGAPGEDDGSESRRRVIGSIKTNLGHLEAAAGLAGLMKIVLSLRHGRVPASLHMERLNPEIDLGDMALSVATDGVAWPAGARPRIAGISSFGSGGTNAHVVVSDHPAPVVERRASAGPALFVLSARSGAQLRDYAAAVRDWLCGVDLDVGDLARLSRRGRAALDVRLAFVVQDQADLIRQLTDFLDAETVPDRPESELAAHIAGPAGRAFVTALVRDGDLTAVAALWRAGVEVDWSLLDGEAGPWPVPDLDFPALPFRRTRHWLAGLPIPEAVEPEARIAATALVPRWLPLEGSDGAAGDGPGDLAIAGAGVLELDAMQAPDELRARIDETPALTGVVWRMTGEDAAPNLAVRALLRLTRALDAAGHADRPITLTLVTRCAVRVTGDDICDPTGAALHGFAGALAEERPTWTVRCLDLGASGDVPSVPASGERCLARRAGRWWRSALSPVDLPAPAGPLYREGGVYVVIGGAGGVGRAWSRHVLGQARAQLIWIGRRPRDAAIETAIGELSALGPPPVYLSADAGDEAPLRAALVEIKRSWPRIDGVVHAAVGAFDRPIAEMTEDQLAAVLAPKVAASLAIETVFAEEPLDFLLVFSSIVALERPGGFAGYAAGGAFQDAWAQVLDRRRPYPVRVINWGHWRVGTAERVSAASQARLSRQGMVPIEPGEAMALLDRALAAPFAQVAVLKWRDLARHPLVDLGARLHRAAASVAPDLVGDDRSGLRDRVSELSSRSLFANPAVETALPGLLAEALRDLGLLDGGTLSASAPAYLGDWLAASRDMLTTPGRPDGERWRDLARQIRGDADLAPAIDLVETCIRALPEVLSGGTAATDILFPEASMRRLEPLYRDNAVADAVNDLLADNLIAACEARLGMDPSGKLRILEIGAGTGGTTTRVLPRLDRMADRIAGYVYTDVSKAFLFHGQERFAAARPYVETRLLDVERDPADQGLEAGTYDAVLATNVLHATADIRRTLAHAKALLKPGGVLLLNEVTTRSIFAHVTFGLLEGWWKPADPDLRIPGSPLLSPERWSDLLEEAGFDRVRFPVPEAGALGQQVIAARSDGWRWAPVKPGPTPKSALRETPGPIRDAPEAADAEAPDPASVAEADAPSGREAVVARLRAAIAVTLRMAPDEIAPDAPLGDYGLDSILIVRITADLRETWPDLDSAFLFQHQTVDGLADVLIRRHGTPVPQTQPMAAPPAAPDPFREPAASAGGIDEPIAIVGLAARMPGASDLDGFWDLLAEGRSAVSEIPADRWRLDGFYEPDPDAAVAGWKSYSKWGAFLDEVTAFDPLFFNIAPKEVRAIDPQERLFLETAWSALEDAGYTRARLAEKEDRRVGVFVGITRTGFDLFGPDLWAEGETVYPHTSFSSVANRLSFFLDAAGPSVPVDTMCSSSLTAMHQAVESLRRGECRVAIAGGVNLYLHPTSYIGLSAARMLSKDGVCRSFGAGANGFVPGEGVAALVLKPLSRAKADGDVIHGLIRATQVNHGGRTNGYTVPNPRAQAALVCDAMVKAGIPADAVSYLEAHGTGTELGDPIEVAGLTEAFETTASGQADCAIGSVKSNIGHLEAAAGIAGVVKVLLQMRHRQLAPTLHADSLNPGIDFDRTPFRVQRALDPWTPPDGRTRIAGISSFGAGGANAHVVLEEFVDDRPSPRSDGPALVVLSAQDEARLVAYAERLKAYVAAAPRRADPPDVQEIAATLQTGREPMAVRLALAVRSLDELDAALGHFISGDRSGLTIARPRDHKDAVAALKADPGTGERLRTAFRAGDLQPVAEAWAKGYPVDWPALHRAGFPEGAPRRISLPTYPFERTRYWLPEPRQTRHQTGRPAPAAAEARALAEASVEPPRVSAPQPSTPQPATPTSVAPIRLIDPESLPDRFAPPADPPVLSLRPTETAAPAPPTVAEGAPPASLEALRRHLADPPVRLDSDGAAVAASWLDGFRPERDLAWKPTRRLPLVSPVVRAEIDGAGVVLVRLEEREARNTFTPRFVDGVLEAFDAIDADPSAKVVVLTGFDTYFACGGTREGLLAIQRGEARFTDEQSYARPLRSPLPVIAAMQGHGIGAGWALGLFSDVAVYARESQYQSPYMRYGFTPGAGSTCVFPWRLGDGLAAEMLFGAEAVSGRDLAEKGLRAPVLPRAEVVPHALSLAWHLAGQDRAELIRRKSAAMDPLRAALPTVFVAELALHDATFVGNAQVAALIARHFGGGTAAPEEAAGALPGGASVLESLRAMLAEELQVRPEQIHDDTAFVELGMDSISAVVWVRKIGERLGVTLGATTIYSHPNLARFAELVASKGPSMPAGRSASPPTELDAEPDPVAIEAEPAIADSSAVLALLLETLAAELSVPVERIDPDTRFVDLGLDSVTAVTWIRGLNERLGTAETGTIVYRHTTPAELARHLAETGARPAMPTPPAKLDPEPHSESEPAIVPKPVPPVATFSRDHDRPPEIAIVGMAGRMPQADDLEAFWRNLVEGRDCVTEIPASRWSIDAYYDPDRRVAGKTVCRSMGALDDIAAFDPLFFNIAPAEAELMDPQQRLFLECAWHAIEDAGRDPTSLAGTACGVYVGCGAGDYHLLHGDRSLEAHALIGESVSMLPARVSYVLDLQGPCLAIDTACSASLVAIAQACDALAAGACDSALAGGVYVLTGPDIHVKMSRAGMLSPSGRCFTFDQRADGFVPGEGVGVVMLKRLEDARRDGDDIRAVVRAWGVNQDGRTNGITAPNQASQARLETDIYRRFGIDPEDIGMVEAHGTGTKLGDPIEVEALQESFRQFTDRAGFCALGSVKSNIGHLATAAGVAGVAKATLAIQRGVIPKTLHVERVNEHLSLEGGPFRLATETAAWPDGPRLAAVSSFGFSGTNAHLVLAEAPATAASDRASDRPLIVPLSAKTPERLRDYVGVLAADLEAGASAEMPLADLAWTLQTGRAALTHRLAVVADSREALRAALTRFHDTGKPSGDLVAGQAGECAAGQIDPTDASPTDLARHWVAGGAVDWTRLWRTGESRRRHGLPGYPFARERYWVAEPAQAPVSAPTPAPTPTPTPAQAGAQRHSRPANDPRPRERRVWRPAPLPPSIDWTARARHWLAEPIVLAGRQPLTVAAETVLRELGRSTGTTPDLTVSGDPPPEGVALRLTRSGAPGAATLRLAARDALAATEADPHGLTLGMPADSDPAVAVQALLQEILAAEPESGAVLYREGERRWSLQAPAERAAPASLPEGTAVITKTWRPAPVEPLTENAAVSRLGTLLLLAEDDALVRPLAELGLAGRVERIGTAMLANEEPGALLQRLGPLDAVVDALDWRRPAANRDPAPMARVRLCQALLRDGAPVRLLLLTREAQPYQRKRPSLAGARMIGLVRMLGAEYGHVEARCVDVDTDDPDAAALILSQELAAPGPETEACHRDGTRFMAALSEPRPAGKPRRPRIDPDGLYVVTGGTSGVGLVLARHLADLGARHLLLIGRRALAVPGDLRDRVASLEVAAADVADREAIGRALAGAGRPIKGVIHAAGVYSDPAVPSFVTKDPERMAEVWRAKADGLEVLADALAGRPLDFFLVLTSMTGLVPRLGRGAADYAMANSYADLFAAYHAERGDLPLRSLILSDWNDTGAITRVPAETAESVRRTFDGIGLRTFSAAEGVALVDLALAGLVGSGSVVGPVDQASFAAARPDLLATGRSAGFERQLADWEAEAGADGTIAIDRVTRVIDLERIRQLPPAQLTRLHRLMFGAPVETPADLAPDEPASTSIGDMIETAVLEVLKLPGVDRAAPLQDYGLDSISGMILATRLEKALGREVQPRWLIDHPSIAALERHLGGAEAAE